jgi:bifunctional UDP-N-acetylglucosamine pyrophosphorylase/glucosamine-1-phosphate N-acetyltransferase
MLRVLMDSAAEVFGRVAVVIGPDMPELATIAAPHPVVIQTERLGTAHAALQAADWFGDGDVVILYADNPLITPETLKHLVQERHRRDAGLALVAMRPPQPGAYGRVILRGGLVERIVEAADATDAERAETLCNAGVMCASGSDTARWLRAVRNDNAKGEYYLTDIVAIARAEGHRVVAIEAPFDEVRGVNSRAELAEAERAFQHRLRAAAMAGGATLVAPETVFLSADTRLEPDVTVAPHVVFGPGVVVEGGAEILSFSHLTQCRVGPGAIVGPFARLRPGADVRAGAHVGNFVELKATVLGEGAKANHLSYLGDAEIGAGTNVGAGTITCNYDGFAKHRTRIGKRAFIGSDAVLVAPLSIGDGAFIAAGSVITEDVQDDAMAFGRARQEEKPGRAAQFRAARQSKGKG